MDYIPGKGYDTGYKCRMSGEQLPVQAVGSSSDPYWQEYATGWKDADDRIIKEARERNNYSFSDISKNFIQD